MIEPQVVFYCDHCISQTETQTMIVDVVRESDSPEDNVCSSGYRISQILTVFDCNQSNVITLYKQDTDFTISGSKIIWLQGHGPLAGSAYTAELTAIKYSNIQYDSVNCPRCAGSGWYTSLSQSSLINMTSSQGTEKLVQEFIKILLTSETDTYGCSLRQLVGKEIYDETQFADDIISAVRTAEKKYQDIQSQQISDSEPIVSSEMLSDVSVDSISYDDDASTIYVDITITTADNTEVEINLNL